MRITEQQVFSSLIANLQRTRAKVFELQAQISTGKQILTPSDDPAGFDRVLLGSTSVAMIDQRIRNVQSGTDRLNLADQTLGSVTASLTRARELAVQFASTTSGASNRAIGASEVRQILLELQRLANVEFNDRPIFGGTGTHGRSTGVSITAPVTLTNGSNDTLTVTVDGVASGSIDLTTGTETLSGSQLAARLQSRVNADTALTTAGKSVTVAYDGDHLVISSNGFGSASSVEVTGGTGRAALGFNGGSTTTGESAFAVAATGQAASSNSGGAVIGQAVVRQANQATMSDYVIRFGSASAFDVVDVSGPVAVTVNGGNTGKAGVTDAGVADATRLTLDTYEIQFTSGSQFNVVDTTTGGTVSAGNTYSSGTAIVFDGLRVVLTDGSGGGPQAGDRFTFAPSTRTVLANQSYGSGLPVAFDGLQVTLTNGSGAPAAGDRFAVSTAVQYQGDAETHRIEVGDGETIPTAVSGDRVFTGETVDLFAVVQRLAAALQGNDSAGIQHSLGELDQGLNQVSIARGEVGALAARLNTTASGLDESKGVVTAVLSQTEDIDLAKAVSEMSLQQVAIQAASQTISRLFDNSLLNFLK